MTSGRPFIRNFWVCGPLMWLALAGAPARAQENTGSLSGSVPDEAGQVLPGATVTLIERGTGRAAPPRPTRGAPSCVTALQPGSYTIRVELTNFRTLERKRNVLSAADRLSLGALRLAVGMGESVVVEAAGTAVSTEDSQHSGLHHRQPDRPDPGQGTRRHDAAAPGARRALRGHRRVARRELRHARAPRERAAPRLEHDHGRRCPRQRGRPDQPHGAADQPRRGRGDQGAAQQLPGGVRPRRRRADPDREQERRRGYHGNAYWYGRSEHWNANNFFNNPADRPRARYRYNTWGSNFGGPIPGLNKGDEKKFFFFYSIEAPITERPGPLRSYRHADRGGARRRLLADPRPERRPDRDPRPARPACRSRGTWCPRAASAPTGSRS